MLNKTGNIMTASALFYGISAVALVIQGFLNDTSVIATMVCIGVASSCMIGANGLLIGVLPMKFFKWGKVSSIAGFLNGFTYVGSALSGFGIGLLAEIGGWSISFIGLGVISVLGTLACLISSRRLSNFLKQ
jgi:OPA family glycerol-3-phosphate transporter-like MFS transporter